jgi:hypothetical protein
MELRRPGMAALRELARRRPVAITQDGPDAQEAATWLRAPLYPQQRQLYARDLARRKRATKKTRRAGATAGGVREFVARSLEQPGWRGTYATDTLKNARKRAWENDTKSGFWDLLRKEGEQVPHRHAAAAYKLGGVLIEVRDGDLILDFSNGSQIELIGADSLSDHTDMRGVAKHVIWVDEVQDFPYLEEFYSAVVVGSLTDTQGECWVTGTPGKDCAGLFYEITKEEEDERLPNWDVHVIASTHNPFFGAVVQTDDGYWVQDNVGIRTGPFVSRDEAEHAAVEVREANTAGLALKENNWKGDEPDFLREQRGMWVKGDARYVYPVHACTKTSLLFAPQRLANNPLVGSDPRFDGHPPWYDHHAAVLDLPFVGRDRRQHKWLYSLWFDFGFHPDPFAAVMWAFTPTLHDVYEMFSWKQTGIHSDDQARYIKLLWEVEPAIVSFGGDSAGKASDFAEWQRRLNLPLEEANKAGKNTLEELLAGDIRRGLVHLRDGSPLYTEMKHLVYLPTAPGKPRQVHKHRSVAGVVHGDHCADAGRYGFAALTHYLSKIGQERPAAGSRAALMAEAEREEMDLDKREAKLQERLLDADELAEEYKSQEGYEW